jgi:hypothetical protein
VGKIKKKRTPTWFRIKERHLDKLPEYVRERKEAVHSANWQHERVVPGVAHDRIVQSGRDHADELDDERDDLARAQRRKVPEELHGSAEHGQEESVVGASTRRAGKDARAVQRP